MHQISISKSGCLHKPLDIRILCFGKQHVKLFRMRRKRKVCIVFKLTLRKLKLFLVSEVHVCESELFCVHWCATLPFTSCFYLLPTCVFVTSPQLIKPATWSLCHCFFCMDALQADFRNASPGKCAVDACPETCAGQIFVGSLPTLLNREHTWHSCGEQQEDGVCGFFGGCFSKCREDWDILWQLPNGCYCHSLLCATIKALPCGVFLRDGSSASGGLRLWSPHTGLFLWMSVMSHQARRTYCNINAVLLCSGKISDPELHLSWRLALAHWNPSYEFFTFLIWKLYSTR